MIRLQKLVAGSWEVYDGARCVGILVNTYAEQWFYGDSETFERTQLDVPSRKVGDAFAALLVYLR